MRGRILPIWRGLEVGGRHTGIVPEWLMLQAEVALSSSKPIQAEDAPVCCAWLLAVRRLVCVWLCHPHARHARAHTRTRSPHVGRC